LGCAVQPIIRLQKGQHTPIVKSITDRLDPAPLQMPSSASVEIPGARLSIGREQVSSKWEILPRSVGFDEVVVAGEFPSQLKERFPHVRFVAVPSQRRDRWDALFQREAGARFVTGDILVFCHDDHAPGEGLAEYLRKMAPTVDILVPKRVHLRTRAVLNNGRADGYMGGHCYAMRRWIWASVSLTVAPDEYWDIYLTSIWKDLGAKIQWTEEALHYDCEAAETEL
jgi:hypothetical protein